MSSKTAIVITGLTVDAPAVWADRVAAATGGAAPDAAASAALEDVAARALAAFGLALDRPGPLLVQGLSRGQVARLLDETVRLRFATELHGRLQSAITPADSIVVGAPAAAVLPGLYLDALQRLGYRPRFVLVADQPLAIAAAARRSSGKPVARTLRLWAQHACAVLAEAGCSAVLDPAAGETEQRRVLLALISGDASTAYAPTGPIGTDLPKSPRLAPFVADLWDLLRRWNGLPEDARAAEALALALRLYDAMVLGEHAVMRPPAVFAAPAAKPVRPAGRRAVVLHYHLFKNAGTSVDAMLRQNFGEAWAQQEFPVAGGRAVRRSNAAAVAAYIEANPQLRAVSSHTALLPVPAIEGVDIFPVLFIRHPIDRLASAYRFERRQNADTFGARLARQTDFAGYVRALLDRRGNGVARNFQVMRLAYGSPGAAGSEFDRAMQTLDRLPFIGLVEAFEQSLDELERLLAPIHPGFRAVAYTKNVSRDGGGTLSSRLAAIEAELGPELHARLLEANAHDLQLFQMVADRYKRIAAPPAIAARS